MRAQADQAEALDIGISSETVCYIVQKAREFDAKVAPSGLEWGSNPTDDSAREILRTTAMIRRWRSLAQRVRI